MGTPEDRLSHDNLATQSQVCVLVGTPEDRLSHDYLATQSRVCVLVGTPEDRLSHDKTDLFCCYCFVVEQWENKENGLVQHRGATLCPGRWCCYCL